MQIADWGRFDGAVVLFGGAYSNLQASQALLASLKGRAAINTGDLVAYCGDPSATVDALRHIPSIAGNCEKQLAAGADDCGCGFETGSTCSLLSRGWFAHADAMIGDEVRNWMASLPDFAVFEAFGRRYGVIHGGVSDVSRFIWSVSEEAVLLEEIAALEAAVGELDGIVAGHSGIAFTRRVERWDWINAGVIGMPEHKGSRDTRYAELTADGVLLHRLAYDWKAAQASMISAGLTQGYHAGLDTGFWPSEDVLPEALRRKDQVASASG